MGTDDSNDAVRSLPPPCLPPPTSWDNCALARVLTWESTLGKSEASDVIRVPVRLQKVLHIQSEPSQQKGKQISTEHDERPNSGGQRQDANVQRCSASTPSSLQTTPAFKKGNATTHCSFSMICMKSGMVSVPESTIAASRVSFWEQSKQKQKEVLAHG